MWIEIYVSCIASTCTVRKFPIFVYDGKIYDVNICDSGNGSKQCEQCCVTIYNMIKNNPKLLNERYTPENPLYLKLD